MTSRRGHLWRWPDHPFSPLNPNWRGTSPASKSSFLISPSAALWPGLRYLGDPSSRTRADPPCHFSTHPNARTSLASLPFSHRTIAFGSGTLEYSTWGTSKSSRWTSSRETSIVQASSGSYPRRNISSPSSFHVHPCSSSCLFLYGCVSPCGGVAVWRCGCRQSLSITAAVLQEGILATSSLSLISVYSTCGVG